MSQMYESQFQPYGEATAKPAGTSKLAVTAFVFSLLGIVPCCFFAAPIGLILGLLRLMTMGSSPARRGRGFAMTAVIIGLLMSAVWGYATVWSYNNLAKPIQSGPELAMRAGFSGNVAGLKSQLFGPGAQASDAEVTAFIDELRRRYGEFRTSHQDQAALAAKPPSIEDMMKPVKVYPYVFEFANKTVTGTAEYSASDPKTGEFFWGMKFGTITIHDPDLGDLTFPSTSVPPVKPAPPSSPPAAGASDSASPNG